MPEKRPSTPPDLETITESYFPRSNDPAVIQSDIRRWLVSAIVPPFVIPVLFYLRFREVDSLAWGLAVFLSTYCLLAAVGLYFRDKSQYHTPVAVKGDWADRVGAGWLVACAFGPFFSWILSSALTLTPENWQWIYGVRVVLCIALPVLTALPLLRYVRGRGAPVMLAILFGVTALPVGSTWMVLRDLQSGPVNGVLPYTGKSLVKSSSFH